MKPNEFLNNPIIFKEQFSFTVGGFILAKEFLISQGVFDCSKVITTERQMINIIKQANVIANFDSNEINKIRLINNERKRILDDE